MKTDIALSIAQTEVLRILDTARAGEGRLNRDRVEAGKPALAPMFFTGEEVDALNEKHAAEIARLKAPPDKPKFFWSRNGRMSAEPGATAGEAFAAGPAVGDEREVDPLRALELIVAAMEDARVVAEPQLLVEILRPLLLIYRDEKPAAARRHAAQSWIDLSIKAFGRKGKKRAAAPPPPAETVAADAASILRAAAFARGEITPLPSDPKAREVIRAGARRRQEPDPTERLLYQRDLSQIRQRAARAGTDSPCVSGEDDRATAPADTPEARAAVIIAAAKLAKEGGHVLEPPPPNTLAAQILLAGRRRRNEA